MTITFRPEQERVIDQAIAAGIIGRADEVVELGIEAIRKRLESGARGKARPAYELSPQEWVRKFDAWTESHAALGLPLLSDKDTGRESIYGDRG